MFDLAFILTLLPSFALVMARISGLMLSAPVFSSSLVPGQVKIGLTVILSLMVFPLVRPGMTEIPDTLVGTALAMGGELLIGLTLGMAVNLLFTGIQLAASMVSQQMGLGLARVFDPMMEEETDTLSEFYGLFGLALLLVLNGHHLVLRGLLDSFSALPPMTVALRPELLDILVKMLDASFLLAVKVAVPTVLILFLVSLMMGFLGKTVPQINILVVGFPLRVGVGFVGLLLSFTATVVVFSEAYQRTANEISLMIHSLRV
jgi:flagellar biosynthetic protein FliR